jgi:hypothetical protein
LLQSDGNGTAQWRQEKIASHGFDVLRASSMKARKRDEEITMPGPGTNEAASFAGASNDTGASNQERERWRIELRRIDDRERKWNGAKKVMKRGSQQDVICCYNGLETFVVSS